MNTVIVGLSPPAGTVGGSPLPSSGRSGRSGRLLANLVGCTFAEYEEKFDRINLHGSSSFPPSTDREAAEALVPILRGRRVILLGGRTNQAFGGSLFRWSLVDGKVVAGVPHPSGLSRWWNNPGNRAKAKKFLAPTLKQCIHVEGPDGSGKSTLTTFLSRSMGLKRIPTDDPPSCREECMSRILRRIVPGVVCDRSSGLVSELVYGPVLRGNTVEDESVLWGIISAVSHAVTFVYCRPKTMLPRTRPGESADHTKAVEKNLEALVSRYDEVMAKVASLGAKVVRYDREVMSEKEVELSCAG